MTVVSKLSRGLAVVAVTTGYLVYVFRAADPVFWTTGLGDWMDPYFINYLLEHWYRAITRATDPASPPMFHPARGTLGYSHGLVLYVPFYVPLRVFFHPFQAYSLALLAAIGAGVLCLYVVFRRFLELSFAVSLLLCLFLLTSHNVMNGSIGVWSQRASVFLIPCILLLALWSRAAAPRRSALALAFLSGLLATLLFTHDFYTAQFAVFFALLAGAAFVVTEHDFRPLAWMRGWWSAQRPAARVAAIAALATGSWAFLIAQLGGFDAELAGFRLRSHDWRRPLGIALLSLGVLLALRRGKSVRQLGAALSAWTLAIVSGAALGVGVFVAIYLPAYLEHPVFPESNLLSALVTWPPPRPASTLELVRAFIPYGSVRPFALVFVVAMLCWLPQLRIDRRIRRYIWWAAAVSLLVVVIPLRFGGTASIWTAFVGRLPGFTVIRDPRRIIYLYDLAVVLAVAGLFSRLTNTRARAALGALVAALLVADVNREQLDYGRPRAVYRRWVEAPVAVHPQCRSFFIDRASDAYVARSPHNWTLYGIDAMFVSLNHSLPTLNGYSAWAPVDWHLSNPHDEDYHDRIRRWIGAHGLEHVCRFDIEAGTMTPFR